MYPGINQKFFDYSTWKPRQWGQNEFDLLSNSFSRAEMDPPSTDRQRRRFQCIEIGPRAIHSVMLVLGLRLHFVTNRSAVIENQMLVNCFSREK